jgi:hypothetical protein
MLSSSWVDRIFERLIGVYGRDFKGKFSMIVDGLDVGIEAAKAAWAEELGFCQRHPECIAFALKNLPDRAPNAIEFKRLCQAAPRKELKTEKLKPLIECSFTPEQIKANQEKIRQMLKAFKN